MVASNRYRSLAYQQDRRIIEHLQKVAGDQSFNRFITFSFVYSKYGTPLGKHDVLMVSRLVAAFFNTVSQRLNGRKRKYDTSERSKVPAIGFPEYRTKYGGKTYLHYHCLTRIPDDQLDYFHSVAKEFWKKAVRHTIGYPPKMNSKVAHKPQGAAFYSNKNIESGFTLENSVFHGISLK